MDKESIGVIFLLAGFLILSCGWFLRKKFHAEADDKRIGSFRFTRGGFMWFIGYLLLVLGTSAVLVSFMLLFL